MRILAATLLLAACTDHSEIVTIGNLQEVLVMPTRLTHDLDVLFMVDDSPSMADKQESLRTSFPKMMDELAMLPGGLPNLHVGVITSDMGASGIDGLVSPMIGGSVGGCMAYGKNGALQTFDAAPIVTGRFISDVAAGTGRARNYTGELRDAFSALANAGSSGCGFEQPLAAIRAALDPSNSANVGFLRDDANLAVVILTDEDDCSLQDPVMLNFDPDRFGPMESFRCTRYGVTCDEGGTTTDAMNQVGPKTSCHQNASSYLADVHALAYELQSRKTDPSQVLVAAIAGTPSPVAVELRPPAGSSTPMPALAHSCEYAGNDGPAVADPAVRLAEFVSQLGTRGAFESVCNADLTLPLTQIGLSTRQMMGDGCLAVTLADTRADLPGIQSMCEATLEDGTALPGCDTAAVGDQCWWVLPNPSQCPDSPDHLRVEIDIAGIAPTPQGTSETTPHYVHVKCLTAE
jgi:hypothetical protein